MFANEKESGYGMWIKERKLVYLYMDCSNFFFGNLGSYSKFLIGGNLGSLGGNFFLISSN